MPLITWTTAPGERNWDLHDLSAKLRERGWQVPAYTFPADRTDLTALRIVCREGFSHDLASGFLDDTRRHLRFFAGTATPPTGGFRH